jgi:hypothetical protein
VYLKWSGRERQCKAITNRGNRCQNLAKKRSKYCGIPSHQNQEKNYKKCFAALLRLRKTTISLGTIVTIISAYFFIFSPKIDIKVNQHNPQLMYAEFNIKNSGYFTLRNTKSLMMMIKMITKDNAVFDTFGGCDLGGAYFGDEWEDMGNILSGDQTTFLIPDFFRRKNVEWKEAAICISLSYSYFLHGNQKKDFGFLLTDNYNQWLHRSCNELRKRYPPKNTSAECK